MSTFFEWRESPKEKYAVVGDPIEHSLSPPMQNAALRSLGVHDRYVGIRVPRAEFSEALEHLNANGYEAINVTTPLKEIAYRWCESCTSDAERVGAVNAIKLGTREGANTDLQGFKSAFHISNATILVLGAGGSASTVVQALADENCKVKCWNRTPERLRQMIERIRTDAEALAEPDPAGCNAIVNCTAAGLDGIAPPVIWPNAEPTARAIDLLYSMHPTPFLLEATERGLRAEDGKAMLVEQGALALEWWTGQQADRKTMAAAIA